MKNKMRPVHPGEILDTEYLKPYRLTANKLAIQIKVPPARLYEIVGKRRGITANTALRLSIALNTTVEFWTNLQTTYDIRMEEISNGDKIASEVKCLFKQ